MKRIMLLLSMLSISFYIKAQNKEIPTTIFLKDSTVKIGTIIREEMMYYRFQPANGGAIVHINKDDILRIEETIVVSPEVLSQYKGKIDTINVREAIRHINLRLENSGIALKAAGAFGIAGLSVGVGGSALAIAGALTGNKSLQWIGVACSGVSVSLLIVSFAQMRAGGIALRKHP